MDGFDRSLAFLIAIDRYQNKIPRLKTPVADATELANVLHTLHDFDTEIIANEQASKESLQTFLDDLQWRVGPDDRVLFYFAGHGFAHDDDDGPQGFILPQDARKDAEANDSFISMKDLNQRLAALHCRHLLVVLDCCFAGAFRWSGGRNLTLGADKLHRERYRWFIEDRAWQAIASAAHDQEAIDVAARRPLGRRDTDADHSPFALALINGLRGEADRAVAGRMGDGVITATELFQFVEDKMLMSAGEGHLQQMPILWLLEKHNKGQFVFLVPGRSPEELPPGPDLNEQANPWRGLESYDEEHSQFFFGRKAASEALAMRLLGYAATETAPALASERFIVVTGPSGIGKSSLVKAGLLPRLPRDCVRSVTMRPGRPGQDAFASLAGVLLANHTGETAPPDARTLREDPCALVAWIQAQTDRRDLVLVVDQLEELVTGKGDEDLPYAFLRLIETTLAETGKEFRVVFTVRPEYEPHFVQSALKDRWASARFPVPQMMQDDLRRVIEGPAAQQTMRFTSDALVDALVNDVAGMPGALPLLSFALSQMYRNYLLRRRDGTDRTLAEEDYVSLLGDDNSVEPKGVAALQGGVTAALRIRANQIVNEGDAAARATARRVLERLVSIEGGEFARRRTQSWEFEVDDEVERARVSNVLKRLLDERLVVIDIGPEDAASAANEPNKLRRAVIHGSYELAHDALIHIWKELSDWVRSDSQRIADLRNLSADAINWHRDSEQVPLWDDRVQVASIEKLKSAPTPGLNRIELDFSNASIRRARRNWLVQISAVVGLIVLALAASIAAQQFFTQRNEALRQESSLFARAAHEATQDNWPDRGIWLALHGLPRGDRLLSFFDRPMEATALGRLSEALLHFGHRQKLISRDQEKDIHDALLLPDERRALVLLKESTVLVDASVPSASPKVISGFGSDRAAVSPDGQAVALANGNRVVVVDVDTGKVTSTLEGHDGPIWTIAFSQDSSRIVTGSYDQTARVWDATTGQGRALLTGHTAPVTHVAFSESGEEILTFANDGTAVVWRATGEPFRSFRHRDEVVRDALFSADGNAVITASSSGKLRVWQIEGDAAAREFDVHQDDISTIDLSPDGTRLVTASSDGTARVVNIESGDEIVSLVHEQFAALVSIVPGRPIVRSAAFSHDGQRVVTAIEGQIRVWDAINGELKQKINLNPDRYHSPTTKASFSNARRHLLAILDRGVFLLDALYDGERMTLRGPAGAALAAAYSPNGRILITAHEEFDAIGWDTRTGNRLFSLGREAGSCFDVVFSPTENKFATASYDRVARYWDAENGNLIASFPHDELELNGIAFSPDGALFLTAGGASAKIWDIRTKKLLKPIHLPEGTEVLEANFSPDSSRVATAGSDGIVRVWSISGEELASTRPKFGKKIVTASFSPDGAKVLAAASDGTAYLWRADDGSLIRLFEGHTSELTEARFSPDGKRLVTSSMDETARIWDTASGKLIAELRSQAGELGYSSFSPDGTQAITAARYGNGIAYVWDTRTGTQITSLSGHTRAVNGVSFSPDGESIVTASSDGTVRIWKAPKNLDNDAELIRDACHALSLYGRTFQTEEAADMGAQPTSDGPCVVGAGSKVQQPQS